MSCNASRDLGQANSNPLFGQTGRPLRAVWNLSYELSGQSFDRLKPMRVAMPTKMNPFIFLSEPLIRISLPETEALVEDDS
jgi:hypothetical protein